MSTDAGVTGHADVPPEADPVRPRRRRRITVFMWIFAVIALCLAIALAIAAAKPAIAVAAAFGLMIPIAVSVLARRRRPTAGRGGAEHRRRRRLVWLIAVPVASAIICLIGGLLLLVGSGNRTGGPPAKTLSVNYHAAGHVEGDGVVVDERIVLDARAMSSTTSAAGAGDASPTVAVSGWQEAGLVDGYPSFARTQSLSWDHMSKLAGTATIPLTLGYLTTTGGSTSSTILVPQNGSKVEIVAPKGAVGAAVPALTSRTDVPSGNHEEVIVFTVDPYVSEVSFDVLRSPLRNPAGHALYDASLWGFWQWAAGAAATAVGGFVVNKLVESLWGLLTRRARSTVGRLRDAGPAA
jgi:hypothetical protein